MAQTTRGTCPALSTASNESSRSSVKTLSVIVPLGAALLLTPPGCSPQPDAPLNSGPPEPTTDNPPENSSSAEIRVARELLKSGQVDDAAARLAQMQVQGTSFDAAQARDYRQAYSEAYDRALEAIQRGDPRGEAALQLLRIAAPR
jgi:hypothetical protein